MNPLNIQTETLHELGKLYEHLCRLSNTFPKEGDCRRRFEQAQNAVHALYISQMEAVQNLRAELEV